MLKVTPEDPKVILFYDGDCGLCNRLVQWILKHEKSKDLFFVSLNSEFAKALLAKENIDIEKTNTLFFYEVDTLYAESDAVLRIVGYLKWYWQWLKIAYALPKFIRDKCYRIIAQNRKRFTVKSCDISSANLNRFLG
jgi:predicted DCC family thiol-disulfide oxidoreductase YuxK